MPTRGKYALPNAKPPAPDAAAAQSDLAALDQALPPSSHLREGMARDYAELSMAPQALQQWVRDQLAPYKYTRRIRFVSALPRTENAKLQRFVLRDWART